MRAIPAAVGPVASIAFLASADQRRLKRLRSKASRITAAGMARMAGGGGTADA
jgi:hypothetical protein